MASAPPRIFSPARRLAARRRALRLGALAGTARYLHDDMAEDMLDRMSFLRVEPTNALIVGDWSGALGKALTNSGAQVTSADPAEGFDEERPYPFGGFDFIASMGTLDTLNDLPGALVHLRRALAPGGLMLASFIGVGSLPALRAAMMAADADRPAPRMHPMIDVRAGGQLLQRAGFFDPVVDSRTLTVRFSRLDSLIADLRAQALGNVLAEANPALSRAGCAIARDHFGEGRTERFEILTLSGWRPSTGSD